MKKVFLITHIVCLCASVWAESKTEIVVKDGIVKTTTNQGDSLIRSGQRAVLREGQEPSVSLNNIMVEKLLQLDRQIEAERVDSNKEIKYTSAQVYSVDTEHFWKVGFIMRMPNSSDKPMYTCRIGTMSILQNNTYYDLQGNVLPFTVEKVKPDEGYYHIQFPQAVEPGEEFKFISVIDANLKIEDFKLLEKINGQWVLSLENGTPFCLNHFHVILPASAVFANSDPAPGSIEEQNGRVAISMHKTTDADGNNGTFKVNFLWPEKDGTSLTGIPWTNAGPEAVEIYELFLQEDIQSPALWGELAVKLVGGGFYKQAYDAFERCYNGHESSVWDYTALTWQGHLYDLWNQREQAIEKYEQALKIKPNSNMRHDQWAMILTQQWLETRLTEPFTENMFIIPESKCEFMKRFDALPWKNAGHDALQLYNDIAFNGVIDTDSVAAKDWNRLGLKLAGAGKGYYSQALNCFDRSQSAGATGTYLFSTLIWQGHINDILGYRQKALEKYQQALELDDDIIGQMRHDQWGIVLTKDWVRQRLETPFTEEMLE